MGREFVFTISHTEGSTNTILPILYSDSICSFTPVLPEGFISNVFVLGEYAVFGLLNENDPAYAACFDLEFIPDDIINDFEFTLESDLSVFVGERFLPGPTGGNNPFFSALENFKRIFTFEDKSAAQDMTLLGQDFVDVFEVEWPDNTGIKKMYVNQDFGMLAFLDENRDLYVWDRFE